MSIFSLLLAKIGVLLTAILAAINPVATIPQEFSTTTEQVIIKEIPIKTDDLMENLKYIDRQIVSLQEQFKKTEIPTTTKRAIYQQFIAPINNPINTPVNEPVKIVEIVLDTQPKMVEPIIEEQAVEEPIKKMKTLEIVSPIDGKGLGREYIANPTAEKPENFIDIGVVFRDENGYVIRDENVKVTTTDSSQDKDMNGASSLMKIYENGSKKFIYYYDFRYEFRFPGDHTITFTSDGISQSVTVSVK